MISLGFFGGLAQGTVDSGSSATAGVVAQGGASVDSAGVTVGRSDGQGAALRPGDGTPFPTVLLALASIATPVQAMTTHPARTAVVPPVVDEESPRMEVHADVGAPPSEAGSDLTLSDLTLSEPPVSEDGLLEVVLLPLRLEAPASDMSTPSVPLVAEATGEEPLVGTAAEPIEPSADGLLADTVTLDPVMVRRLSQDFVPRLERVTTRMWEEHGLRLDIVEGYRPQSRQNALFAQGRTAEGPVVTWTQRSLHTAGAAADVFVNGGPVTPDQAVLLSRVASEEGLRTLYPFDSGHIQLDRGRGADGPEGDLGHTLRSTSTAPAVPVNRVARPAPVARPARPARPGGMASAEGMNGVSTGTGELPVMPSLEPRSGAAGDRVADLLASVAGAVAKSAGSGDPGREARGGRGIGSQGFGTTSAAHGSGSGEGSTVGPTASAPLPESAASSTAPAAEAQTVDPRSALVSAGGPAPAGAGDGTIRGGEAVRPGAAAPPLPESLEVSQAYTYRRLHLPIEGIGGRASLDLGIRPGGMDAAVTVSDPSLAETLRGNLHELRQALADRGIDSRGLSVRLAADTAVEATGLSQELTPSRGGESSNTSNYDGRRNASDRMEDERERNERARAEQDQNKEEKDAPRR